MINSNSMRCNFELQFKQFIVRADEAVLSERAAVFRVRHS